MTSTVGLTTSDLEYPDLGHADTFNAGPRHDLWDRMRTQAPVQRNRSPELGIEFFSVTTLPEIRTVLGDADTFVSRYGIFLGFGPQAPDPASGRMLVVTDGEPRRRMRAAMSTFFTPRWIRRMESGLTALMAEHLRAYLDGQPFDFAEQVAWRVPMMAICRILDIPSADEDELCTLAGTVLTTQDPACDRRLAEQMATRARSQILAYFTTLLEQRRAGPGDDVVSSLQGELDPTDATLNLLSLLVAANETTRLSLTGAMVAFSEHPAQLALLNESPGLVDLAVEEVLRWTSPGMNVSRTTARSTILGGVDIGPGEVVTSWLPAGNRDPNVFDRPHQFDIARQHNPHAAFGHGVHNCIGGYLARLELRTLVRFLQARVARIDIAGKLSFTHSTSLSGYARAVIRLGSR